MTPRDTRPTPQHRKPSRRRGGRTDPEELSDSDLVERSRAGDELAYAELWRRHARAGLTVARSASSTLDPDDLVAEAFLKILQAVQSGKGPQVGFRPYLFTTIRNVAASWGRDRRESPLEDAEAVPDPETTESTTLKALERSLTAQAFRSLPDRWQEVLWYCDVEQLSPASVAPLLGLSPNGVSALAYRAREGLRQAWIQVHLQSLEADSECRWVTDRMGAYSRGRLAARETKRFEAHLLTCARCTIVLGEARDVGSRLALIVLPLTVGTGAAAAYAAWIQGGHNAVLASAGSTAAAPLPASVSTAISPAGPAGGAAGGAGAIAGGVTVAAWTGGGLLAAAAVAGVLVLGPQLLTSGGDGPTADVPVATAPRALGEDGTRGSATSGPLADAPVAEPPASPRPGPSTPPVPPGTGRETGQSDGAAPSRPGVPADPAATEPATPSAPTGPTTPTGPTAPADPQPLAAPVVTSPWESDRATSATAVDLAGTGTPGAIVGVAARPSATSSAAATASTPASPLLASTIVSGTGAWSLAVDLSSLADGSWLLDVDQRTSARTSAPTTLGLLVDRTALPPVIAAVDTGTGALAGRAAPIVSGTAEPGASVVVSDGDRALTTVTADGSGSWSTGELMLASPSYALTARQTDEAGNVSPPSAAVTGIATAPDVFAIGSPFAALLVVHGEPGDTVEVWLDGAETGHTLALDSTGYGAVLLVVAPGDHRVGATVVVDGRHGVLADTAVSAPS
ncbi:hypothetical protein LLS1_05950 [Leifsonia sp. LS1]|uniref:sigma-70 family RNA polymerase sigma factor n=1 Tax=Leifsonia sp. LS1 TaxID=2828483 RepID=UPI001CFCE90C|nr:sigma-70 family RNA polymerase sigma factor [Leifsonia sp. LS1]GIT78926.1 hypothetical protein LLS1_05950 [Leifsonia sp. LS1]